MMRSLSALIFTVFVTHSYGQPIKVPPMDSVLLQASRVKTVTPQYVALSDELVHATTLQDSFNLYMDLGMEAMRFDIDRKKVSLANYLEARAIAARSGILENQAASALALAEITRRLDRYDEYLSHCQEAISIGHDLRLTDSLWLARAYLEQGIYHYKHGQYADQIRYAQRALNITAGNFPAEECRMLYYLGYGHYLLGDYELALEAYLKTYTLAEGGHCDRKAMHLSMAEVYLADGSHDRAIEHLVEARSHARPDNLDYDHAEVLRFLAEAQWLKGNYELAMAYADSSIMINQGRYEKNYGYAHLFASRACLDLGRYDDALDYMIEGHRMVLTEIQPNKVLLCQTYKQLGRVYHAKGMTDQGMLHLDSSLFITEAAGFLKVTSDTRLVYAQLLEEEGDASGALTQYRLHMALNDSLLNATTSQQLANMKVKYDTDKKDLENANLLKNNALISARNQRYTIGGIIMTGLLVALGFFYARLRRTKSVIMTQHATISDQNKELAALDRIKTNFFSNITHEFRTPLTLILEPVRQLLKTDLDEAARHSLRLVRGNADQLLGLVNQLLDVAKIEGGQMAVSLRRAKIEEVVAPIIDSFRPLAQKKRIELHTDIEDDISPFYMDVPKVEKVINNLISNAVKYTDGGVVAIQIKVDIVGEEASDIVLAVKDTGVGIPETALHLIFDRFYQVDSSTTRAGAGTGIGLSLTKELIELMGGKISVDSKGGVGSTFRVTIPMKTEGETQPVDAGDIDPAKSNMNEEVATPGRSVSNEGVISVMPKQGGESNESGKPLILVVEDNLELRSFIKQSLNLDYDILEAEQGQQGLERAREHIPDLIVSDIMMPIMDGVEMARSLRNDLLTAHIPIILLTAKSAISSKIEGLQSGVDAYLTKPFHTEELQVRIAKLIESRRLLRLKYSNGLTIEEVSAHLDHTNLDQQFLHKLTSGLSHQISDRNLSVEDLAKDLFLSRSQLFRKVKALTGMSPSEFIRNYRLDRAKDLLANNKVSVVKVSETVGFGDEKYFSTRFKERFGMSPSEV